LDAKANNYLLAMARARASSGGDRIGLAWIDISTSEFVVTECSTSELAATLSRINPNEVIVTDALYGDPELGPLLREPPAVTPRAHPAQPPGAHRPRDDALGWQNHPARIRAELPRPRHPAADGELGCHAD